jgi:hypothetical protein
MSKCKKCGTENRIIPFYNKKKVITRKDHVCTNTKCDGFDSEYIVETIELEGEGYPDLYLVSVMEDEIVFIYEGKLNERENQNPTIHLEGKEKIQDLGNKLLEIAKKL